MLKLFRSLPPEKKRILLTCFFAFFVNGTLALMMGSMLPDMKLTYGLTDTQSGLMLSAHSIGNMVAGFVSGLLPLWLGRRRSITMLSGLTCLGFALMCVFGNPVWLIGCFIFTGIGRGGVSNFNNATVNQVSGGNPAASNLLHCFFAVGAFTAPLVFLLLNSLGGWRIAACWVALLALMNVLLFSRLHLENDHPDRKDKTQSTLRFMKNPSFVILGLMMFFYLCSEYAINGWLVTYLQSKQTLFMAVEGVDAAAQLKSYSQTMATLLWVIILVGRLTCALLSQRIPQKTLMLAASVGVAGFFALLLFSNAIFMVTLAVAGLGFCMAGICPMIYSDAAPFTNAYPMATSILLAIGSAGSILMPTIVGMTADAFGFAGGMSTIMVTICCLLVCALLNRVVKPRMAVAE